MRRFLLAALPGAAAVLALVPPAAAYRVTTFDGREIEADAIVRLDEGFALRTDEGTLELPQGSIDFYSTFRANLGDEPGNALAFKGGGFLRFEALAFDDGRITIELEEGMVFTVHESVIDFRKTVVEGSLLELPADYGDEAAVAKSTGRATRSSAGRSQPRGRRR